MNLSWPKLAACLSLGLGVPLIFFRHKFFGQMELGNFFLAGAMAVQFAGYQRMLSAGQAQGMAQGIEISQWGWFLFALGLPGQGPALATAGFLVSHILIKSPVVLLLSTGSLGHRWILLGSFLALVGCLPFSTFSAYFQAFVPLMAVGDGVSTMQQKLFSGTGLWAALVLLSVVYQSCALGYFYWSQVMVPEPGLLNRSSGPAPRIALAGLCLSAVLGIFPGFYSNGIRAFLSVLGIVF